MGLRNRSCRCYLIAALQCLYHLIPLRSFFLDVPLPQDSAGPAQAYKNLQQCLAARDVANLDGCLAAIDSLLRSKASFESAIQYDMHEALIIFLDLLEKDLDQFFPRDTNIIRQLFTVQFRTEIVCPVENIVKTSRTTIEYFLPLDLPSNGHVKLTDCLKLYFEDALVPDWFCPDCKLHLDAAKRTSLASDPPVLAPHLKRFGWEPGDSTQIGPREGYSTKINTEVEFPETLEIYVAHSETEGEMVSYHLQAMAGHQGSPFGGHYVAYVSAGGRWYACSDTHITIVTIDLVLSAQPYLLFCSSEA
jgi:ubiquitin C-terminal hydrolase